MGATATALGKGRGALHHFGHDWNSDWSVPMAMLSIAALVACGASDKPLADPTNASQVASGKAIYAANCASCHGANLEGQANWKSRNPIGRMPAPPHDDTGHTWHHPDDI